jgi:hypothetical protein
MPTPRALIPNISCSSYESARQVFQAQPSRIHTLARIPNLRLYDGIMGIRSIRKLNIEWRPDLLIKIMAICPMIILPFTRTYDRFVYPMLPSSLAYILGQVVFDGNHNF